MSNLRVVQLPNGDLWRGRQVAERADTLVIDKLAEGENVDDVLAQMITSQKGEAMSCVFCGQQFSRKQLNELREHVETLHKSVVKPVTDRDALLSEPTPENLEILAQIDAPRME